MGIRIEFHSLGAVYEYDLLNMEERGLGTANAPLTDDRSVRLCMFWSSVNIWFLAEKRPHQRELFHFQNKR